MRYIDLTVFFLFTLILNFCTTKAQLVEQSDCYGRILRTDNDGAIFSHSGYGKSPCPSNLNCNWFLQAPFNNVILVFIAQLDIANSDNLLNDNLKFFSGISTNFSDPIKTLNSFNIGLRFIFTGNQFTITFKSANNFNHTGFQLRYAYLSLNSLNIQLNDILKNSSSAFTETGAAINVSNINANSTVEHSYLLEASTCYNFENKCRTSNTCLYNDFFCDGIIDCADGSDEDLSYCTTLGINHHPIGVCYDNQVRCNSGECIPQRYWCDGQIDCQDGSDESDCNIASNVFNPIANDSNSNAIERCVVIQNINNIITANIATRSGETCSKQPIPPLLVPGRIVGGTVARPGSWPWIISLRFMGQHICGGSIIADRWILTASHCVYGKNQPSYFQVYAGLWQIGRNDANVQMFNVVNIIMNPNYNPGQTNNDVTVIQIDGQFTWSDYVQPVCLPNNLQDAPNSNTLCYALGWGETQGTGGAGYLKQVRLPVVNANTCTQIYGGRITQQMMCAGYMQGGADACQGDSGGPFVCLDSAGVFQLNGVTSWGAGCAQPNAPGVYANVVMFANWIRQTLNAN